MKLKHLFFVLSLMVNTVWAQSVVVSDAWVRATVASQNGTAAYLKLQSKDAAKLVGVSSNAANVAQIHEMKMQGDVMSMAPVAALDLPAGQTVELKQGSVHIMLMDLKQPLIKDSTIDLTLKFQDAAGKAFTQTLQVPVRSMAPGEGHHHHAM
jgi:copper(I)-binding protein